MNQASQDLPLSNRQPQAPHPMSQEQYWQAHINQWSQSGLSQSSYCRREGLILHRWHYWHKKLTRASAGESKPSSEFIPVTVVPEPMNQALSITLPNGICIGGVNSQTLALLGAVLKQL